MSTKSREVIWGGRMGAKIRADGAREDAIKALRAADRAQAEAWSIRMEGYGGPAQPSPTIAQCLNGGLGWLEVRCHRCETKASIPLDAIRRSRDTPNLEARGIFPLPIMRNEAIPTAGAHDQADRDARDNAVQMGAPGRGEVTKVGGPPAPDLLSHVGRAVFSSIRFRLASRRAGKGGIGSRGVSVGSESLSTALVLRRARPTDPAATKTAPPIISQCGNCNDIVTPLPLSCQANWSQAVRLERGTEASVPN